MCVAPGQDGHAVVVIGDGVHRVTLFRQSPGCPRLAGVEVVEAFLLHLEPQVDAPEDLDRLLDVRVVLHVDRRVREDLVVGGAVLAPVGLRGDEERGLARIAVGCLHDEFVAQARCFGDGL